MVFHGVSRGCKTCLKRRVKCDESRPTCTRCIKSNRECLGYRDESTILFRDQTLPTAQRVHLRATTASSSNSDNTPDPADRPTTHASSHGPVTQTTASICSWEQEAVETLMRRMVLSAAESDACQGPFIALPLLYSKASKDSALHAAVIALAVHINPGDASPRHGVKSQVWTKYGQALERVSRALRESSAVQNDEILMTILIFCIIENLTATYDSLPSLAAHNDAIELLVQNRGMSIMRDEIGISIFFGVRSLMAINHAFRSIPLVDLVNGQPLTWDDVPDHIRINPINTLTTVGIPVANLRVLADEILYELKSESHLRGVRALIERCKATDKALVEWLSTLSSSWGCVAIENEKMTTQEFDKLEFAPCPWLTRSLVYRDVWVAHLHNTYYMFRAFLQSIILRCGIWMTGITSADLNADEATLANAILELASEFLQAREQLLKIFESICGSVSFMLGAAPNVQSFPDLQLPFRCQTAELGPPLLVRPLFVAQSVIVAPQYQRSWVESILRVIGTRYSIGIARLLAEAKGFKGRPLFLARLPLNLRPRPADIYDGLSNKLLLEELQNH